VVYAKKIHKDWAAGNAVQKMLAPMFHAEIEGQATAMAQAVRVLACGQKRALDQAYTDAKGLTVHSYHKMEKNRQLDHYVDLRERSVNDFKLLTEEVVEVIGTRNSRWEKLFDENTGKHYHYNWKIGKREDDDNPAVCEVCDVIIDPVDFKCFDCNSLRSGVNQSKYRGHTALEDLMDVEDLVLNVNTNKADLGKHNDDMDDFDIEEEEDDEGGGMMARAKRLTRKSRKNFGKSKVADVGRKSFGGIKKSFTSGLKGLGGGE